MKGLIQTSSATPRTAPRLVIFLAIAITLLVGAHLAYSFPEQVPKWKIPAALKEGETPDHPFEDTEQQILSEFDEAPVSKPLLPCQKLPGGEDVVVVMRTGATEIRDKLPVHLKTTLQCYNDYVLMSDYAEEFEGEKVHDLLAGVDDRVKDTHPDFELYRRLRENGRDTLDGSELSGAVSQDSGAIGKIDNQGWRLDKWKFLPMALRTMELRPEKKWYVFVEPDTYLVWSNLLDWLKKLDPEEPAYYGSEVQIGEDVFAHGGSAFVVSNPGLKRVADMYQQEPDPWHDLTSIHWAGDCILGKALLETGTPLTWSWPMFQGGNPQTMDYKEDKGDARRLWCAPAISYHHLSPSEIQDMFNFEQQWLRQTVNGRQRTSKPVSHRQRERLRLHHQDVFRHYVLPNVTQQRMDWNNASPDLRAGTQNATLDDCRIMCERDATCVQYSKTDMGCYFSNEAKMGQSAEGVQSGWLEERVQAWADGHQLCERKASRWVVT